MIAAPIARRALDLYHDGVRRYQASLVMAHHDLAEVAHLTGNPLIRHWARWRVRGLGRKVRLTIEELAEGREAPYLDQQDRGLGNG